MPLLKEVCLNKDFSYARKCEKEVLGGGYYYILEKHVVLIYVLIICTYII